MDFFCFSFSQKHEKVKDELKKVQNEWTEAQRTLEELGIQLSVSKLQISDLKERAEFGNAKPGGGGATNVDPTGGGGNGWTPDRMTSRCKSCNREFSMTRRKHHCRNCGEIFCHNCSDQLAPLPDEQGHVGRPVRVCDGCWDIINLSVATKN